ncbi:hypothetical protein ABW21_db0203246 [Orbilia brochopaga]|nr:hypothetical protein ABW21_db0203246 [Drechslerella brochopaga]
MRVGKDKRGFEDGSGDGSGAKTVHLVRWRLLTFIGLLHAFLVDLVLRPQVEGLKARLAEAEDLDEMIDAQEEHFGRIEDLCLLSAKLAPLGSTAWRRAAAQSDDEDSDEEEDEENDGEDGDEDREGGREREREQRAAMGRLAGQVQKLVMFLTTGLRSLARAGVYPDTIEVLAERLEMGALDDTFDED